MIVYNISQKIEASAMLSEHTYMTCLICPHEMYDKVLKLSIEKGGAEFTSRKEIDIKTSIDSFNGISRLNNYLMFSMLYTTFRG